MFEQGFSFEEGFFNERIKRFSKIGLILIISLILIFFLVKSLISKPEKPIITPPLHLEEIRIEWKKGEKVKIKENVFLELINIEEYVLEGIKSAEGFKFLSLEVEYENRSKESIYSVPCLEWKVIDQTDNPYNPIYPRETSVPSSQLKSNLRKPILFNAPVIRGMGGELSPNNKEKGYISFEVAKEIVIKEFEPIKDIVIKEVVFQNLQKKIIFQIPLD